MASQYSLINGSNGTKDGAVLNVLFSVALKLIPIILAGYAIYGNKVTSAGQTEATRVEVQRLKDDVAYINGHYVSREEMRELMEPLKEATSDQKQAIRSMEEWLREQQRGRYGRTQPN